MFPGTMLVRLQTAVVLSLIASCAAHSGPAALVGSSVSAATARLGVHPTSWQPAAAAGYDVACAFDEPVTLFGERGTVCLVRRGDTVAALEFRVDGCTGDRYDALRKAVIDELGLSGVTDRDVYVVRRSGVVHLRPADDGADLVLTDAEYGDLYVKEQLRQGFVDLSNGLRPH